MLQNATPLRKSVPRPPNISDEHVFCTAPREMHLSRSSSNVPRLPTLLKLLQNPHILLTFGKVQNPLRGQAKPHLNFQKWSEHVVFLTFWLGNMLRSKTACTFCEAGVFCTFWLRNALCATTGCNFSSLIWPAGSTPAALASLLFDPSEPQIIGKKHSFATFLPFRTPASSFFSLFLFSDLVSSSLLLSDSSHLCFPSVHIFGSLTSKLPSNMWFHLGMCISI